MLAGTYASRVQCGFTAGRRFVFILHPLLFVKQNVPNIFSLCVTTFISRLLFLIGFIYNREIILLIRSYFNHLNDGNKSTVSQHKISWELHNVFGCSVGVKGRTLLTVKRACVCVCAISCWQIEACHTVSGKPAVRYTPSMLNKRQQKQRLYRGASSSSSYCLCFICCCEVFT